MTFEEKHVAIIGGGLVGALNACFMAKRGYKVDVYEMRSDIRKVEVIRGRSINMALSVRGREALRMIGLEDMIVSKSIPMHARMIHDLDGTRRAISYGQKHQYIMSIDRRHLNELLLTAAESHSNVALHFDHQFRSCDFSKGEITLRRNGIEDVQVMADLIFGCDGAYSAVRAQMMKSTRMDYSQEFINHGYIELCIPATSSNEFAMEINYLHIWPRHKFMMIALPNSRDRSFVVTLFMPFAIYDTIKNEDDLMSFFKATFPDAIELLGEPNLKESFFKLAPQPLVSVKCCPYNIGDVALLLGDASHAMVPFYGQGMNAGFEDCIVLNDLLNKHKDNLNDTLSEFTLVRHPDAIAICDLAMYNYYEMRSKVNSRRFLLRKRLDIFLNWLMPSKWIPLYTMVSFSRIRYHECIKRQARQDMIVHSTLILVLLASVAGLGFGSYKYPSHFSPSSWQWVKDTGSLISRLRVGHIGELTNR